MGTYEAGKEARRVRATLATSIPEPVVRSVGLGCSDPAAVDPAGWSGPDDLVVAEAGEDLCRLVTPGGPSPR